MSRGLEYLSDIHKLYISWTWQTEIKSWISSPISKNSKPTETYMPLKLSDMTTSSATRSLAKDIFADGPLITQNWSIHLARYYHEVDQRRWRFGEVQRILQKLQGILYTIWECLNRRYVSYIQQMQFAYMKSSWEINWKLVYIPFDPIHSELILGRKIRFFCK